jgi:3'(2'), 5'-bisphosphate nucleotidase
MSNGIANVLVERLVAVARDAGGAVARIYASDFAVRHKADASPVTDADLASEAIILAALRAMTPGVPIVSEEAAGAGLPAVGERFWLVDPLDGTLEFVRRNGEFTVNIALIEDRQPVIGVVYAPALDRLFAGVAREGAFAEEKGLRRPVACRREPPEGLAVVSSRSHADAVALRRFLAGRKVATSATLGSSLKFCLVASGEADLYPRFGRTHEWDTAAGHAVLRAAGGRATDLDGRELLYGKPGLVNPGFVACGLPAAQPGDDGGAPATL